MRLAEDICCCLWYVRCCRMMYASSSMLCLLKFFEEQPPLSSEPGCLTHPNTGRACPDIACPHCRKTEFVSHDGWATSLRRYMSMEGLCLLLQQNYRCSNIATEGVPNSGCPGIKPGGKSCTFLAGDPRVLSQLPEYIANEFPCVLTKGTGLSRQYLERLALDVVSGEACVQNGIYISALIMCSCIGSLSQCGNLRVSSSPILQVLPSPQPPTRSGSRCPSLTNSGYRASIRSSPTNRENLGFSGDKCRTCLTSRASSATLRPRTT